MSPKGDPHSLLGQNLQERKPHIAHGTGIQDLLMPAH